MTITKPERKTFFSKSNTYNSTLQISSTKIAKKHALNTEVISTKPFIQNKYQTYEGEEDSPSKMEDPKIQTLSSYQQKSSKVSMKTPTKPVGYKKIQTMLINDKSRSQQLKFLRTDKRKSLETAKIPIVTNIEMTPGFQVKQSPIPTAKVFQMNAKR